MRRVARIDKNQPEIVEALRKYGACVLHTHQLKEAFDILVGYKGSLFIMEIKDPKNLPKNYDKARLEKSLKKGEFKCMVDFEAVGVPYYIVTSIEQAIKILKDDSSN